MLCSPQRILVIKFGSLGDILHTLPAVGALRKRFPQAHVTWMVKHVWRSILEGNPHIDDVLSIDFSWKHWVGIIRRLKKGNFDVTIDFQGLLRSGFCGWLTGAPTRLGFAQAREGASFLYTHRVPLRCDSVKNWRLLGIHAVDRNLAIVEFLGAHTSEVVFPLPAFKEDEKNHERLLQDEGVTDQEVMIAIAPWTRSKIKTWPSHKYQELIRRLGEWPGIRVVLIGGPDEVGEVNTWKILNTNGLINVVGKLSLRQLPGFLKHMKLIIGNDSGLIHLAAGVGTPVLALFGPTSVLATGPYPLTDHEVVRWDIPCSPCGKRTCTNPNYLECMNSIEVQEVLHRAQCMMAYQKK